MKRKEFMTYRGKSVAELEKAVAEKREQLWTVDSDIKKGTTKNVRELRGIRKAIAQIKTLISEKKLEQS